MEALAQIRGDQVLAEWGQQIRSYVLAPYKMVKDLRTQHETSQVPAATTRTICDPLGYLLRLPPCPRAHRATLPSTGAGRARRPDRALWGRLPTLASDGGREWTVRLGLCFAGE